MATQEAMTPIVHRATSDILSHFRDKSGKRIVYAKKGDIIKEISRSGDVIAAEGPDGERFPAHMDYLVEYKSL